ncbi:DUF6477 family protein [Cohaesibacter sp. CAU 1516]|uniref:DUF6477 family protein n=1 Tax=Cohaesibacter sp. CAU 1516 TaxID=2576038 RepID=UPI001FED2D05|nr:DUF6477 family protein [Cohaesibacter sp. CAU 1516]
MTKRTDWRNDCAQGQASARCDLVPAHRLLEPFASKQAVCPDLVEQSLRHGEKIYDRRRDLPGLLHLFPADIDRLDRVSSKAVLQKLTLLVKGERARGRTGHWRYSLARHIGLSQALRAEKLRLMHERRKGRD